MIDVTESDNSTMVWLSSKSGLGYEGFELNISMKFYDREKDISRFREIEQVSRNNEQITVVVGRIGKTQFILKAT